MNRAAALLVATVALATLAGCSGGSDAPAVVIVIGDTVRADHLSAYGYERATSPALEQLAAEGVRFDAAYAQSSWTLPTIATILTGQPPHRHGAGRVERAVRPLFPDVPTIAERLQLAGWETAAFVNVVWLDPKSGLARGFDTYDLRLTDASNLNPRNAAATTDDALGWLEGQARDEPFLLVVHYFDPHMTYDPPAPWDTEFDEAAAEIERGFGSAQQIFEIRAGRLASDERTRRGLEARYDGELRFIDEQFARLRKGLERQGRWDDALVLFVGDHGEEFWDHAGFEHGHTHFEEMIRVPLIVRDPTSERAGGTVATERVRQLDIVPTVLDFAGLAAKGLPGRVLGSGGATHTIAEGSLWSGDLLSIRSDAGSVIWSRDNDWSRYYAPDDPQQLRPLPVDGEAASELLELLEALPPEQVRPGDNWQPTPEQLERLKSLGYVR